MDTERVELHDAVREGYQLLLRADAVLALPRAHEQIAAYYRALAQKCMEWICGVYGERVRQEFLALADVRDKARFRTRQYRFSMQCVWEREALVAFLCESTLAGDGVDATLARRRTAQLWRIDEEQILPREQIEGLFLEGKRKARPPFSPDGMYPCGVELIFFKNPTKKTPGAEWRAPIGKNDVL